MNFGMLFLFRNPPQWHRPFAQYYAEQLELARQTEALGYDMIWLSEHHFSEDGYCPSVLTVAGAIATMTKRVRIGTNLLVLPLHHPVRVAEDAATVDVLSNGRFELGVGRGYLPTEFNGYGISRNERGSRLSEGLEIIHGIWTQKKFSFQGKHYNLKDVRLEPRPVQTPHPPIWVGTHGPKTMDMIVRKGFHLLSGSAQLQVVFDSTVEKHGRSLAEHNAAQLTWVHVAETWEQAWDNAQDHFHYMYSTYQDWLAESGDLPEELRPTKAPPAHELRNGKYDEIGTVMIGNPDQVAAQIQKLTQEARTTHIVLGMNLPGLDPKKTLRSMELFAKHVMPRFRQS